MRAVLVDKIPFLRMCRIELKLHAGAVDYHELIESLCDGIRSMPSDRDHIQNVITDLRLFPNGIDKESRVIGILINILSKIRSSVVKQIHADAGYPKNQHIQFVRTGSKMSLRFNVFE